MSASFRLRCLLVLLLVQFDSQKSPRLLKISTYVRTSNYTGYCRQCQTKQKKKKSLLSLSANYLAEECQIQSICHKTRDAKRTISLLEAKMLISWLSLPFGGKKESWRISLTCTENNIALEPQ